MLLKLSQVLASLTGVSTSSRILGKASLTNVMVLVGPDRIRPIKTIGVDAGGSVLIVLAEEGEPVT